MHDDTTSALLAGPRTGEESAADSANRLRRGTTVGRYIVIDRLGGGGMGDVYSAWDEDLRRRVALKLIRPRAGADLKAQVLAEARALARLRHPHVVAVHDVGQDAETVFVSMALLEGPDLLTWSAQTEPDLATRLDVVFQCADGLSAAHAAGLVHHDVKPSNIVVESKDGAPKVSLIDFGLATDAGGGEARGGTRAYMAPERRDGGPGLAASDQWSLALMTAELLGGARPPLSQAVAGELSSCGSATTVLRRALRADPDARYQNVDEFSAALRRATRSRGRSWVAAAAVAIVSGAVIAAVPQEAEPTCSAQAQQWVAVHGGQEVMGDALAQLREARPALGEPMEQQLDAWQIAWTDELTEACEKGAEPQATCRDLQREEWTATLRTAGSSQASEEGEWALLAHAAQLANPCFGGGAGSRAEAEMRALEVAHRPDEAFAVAEAVLAEVGEHSVARARVLSRMSSIQRQRDETVASLALADEAMLLAGKHNEWRTMARTAVDRVYTLVLQGEYGRAEDALRVARPLVAAAGDSPDLVSAVLEAKARLHEIRFEMVEARSAYENSLALKHQIAPGSAHEADTLRELGSVLSSMGDCDTAMEHLTASIAIYTRFFGPGSPSEAEALQAVAVCQAESGEGAAAVTSLERSAKILADTLGSQSVVRGLALAQLSDLLWVEGHREEALKVQGESMDIKRATLGPDHRETLLAQVHLGWKNVSAGHLEQARATLVPALATAASVADLDEVDWTQLEGARAALLEAEGDLEGAVGAQTKSVEHLRLGMADLPQTWVLPLMNLASLEHRLGRVERAREIYAEARELAVEHSGGAAADLLSRIDAAVDALK